MDVIVVAAKRESLSAQLTLSLTQAEKAAVRALAKASGLSMSAWGRQVVTAAAAAGNPTGD